MKQDKTNNFGIGKYAIYCCGILYHIKDVEFKRCRRCGKILKDTSDDSKTEK